MKRNKKLIALVCSVLLLVGAAGATLAWLTDTTDNVVNTFTSSDVNVTLEENTGDEYKMVPGNVISKDPTVTVEAGSEACYVFVEITKSANYDDYMEAYVVEDNWTLLEEDGNVAVYYTVVGDVDAALTADEVLPVLKDNQVTVKTDVTKEMMEAIDGVVVDGVTEQDAPTLTFQAFVVQLANIDSAADAWDEL